MSLQEIPRPRLTSTLSRWRICVALAIAWLCVPAGQPAHAATPRHRPAQAVAADRDVALLFAPHTVFRGPNPRARALSRRIITTRRPITGERTALPVITRRTDATDTKWLKVMLPGRPNGSTGWIQEHNTRLISTPWHLLIDLHARTLTTYFLGRPTRSFRAVIGTPSTPTPTGAFFVEETMRLPTNDPGGPYALALSARSNVLHTFDGGPGQIAIHGRAGLGGTLGDAQSHGCIRLANTAITWLARWITPGVPVTIRGH